jgi:WD40 repeat protein
LQIIVYTTSWLSRGQPRFSRSERKLDTRVPNGLYSVAVSPGGKIFATAGFPQSIRLWDFAAGRLLKTLKNPSAVSQVVFSNDGKLLASAGDDRMIRLWDVDTGQDLRKLEGHSGVEGKGVARGQIVTSVAFHPDGKLLASAAALENTVRLWNVASGRLLRTIKAHTGTVTRVVFHPSGKALASSGEDRTVKLWDVSEVVGGAGDQK